ncbi:MAG: 3-oxoacyl-ACP reductase FabG [Thermodesulfobacteriota bacterium]|nr:3-oxoacyl-ACP reductase FabG [Thermodesulfobacteriota bacterium]
MRLKGRVAVITGSGQGLGRGYALEFARQGANIVVNDVNEENANNVVKEIEELGGKSIAVKAAVNNREDAGRLINTAIEKLGRVDILVNNAGITRTAMLHKMTQQQWDDVISVNLTGVYNCIQAVAAHMMERKSGKIINVTSVAGLRGTMGQINYGAAKAGVIGITKSAARELARYGINVNAVAPGVIETAMTEVIRTNPKFRDKFMSEIPMGRFGQPEDVATVAAFLASDDAGYMTGQVLSVDGGIIM